jgi:ABC-type polysaccharide/polyol phosphate export permease
MAFVDFKSHYYNKKLGLLWAFLVPAIQIALYYFIFHSVFQTTQENYVLYLFSAMIVWLLFIQSGNLGLELLRQKKHLLESVQFNWLDLYLSNQIARTYSMGIQLVAYFALLLFAGVSIGTYWYYFPLVLLTWFLFSYSISILLGLAFPIFEDIYHIWNLAGMIGLWSSGIFFDGTFYFEDYSWFAYFNPMVGIILNSRAILLEGHPIYFNLLVTNILTAIALTFFSVWLFQKSAKKIVEHG